MSELILSLSNIHKAFFGHPVHKGVTINLHKGETLGLLGNSGTGKSVLLRSIIGLEYIDKGEIQFRGNNRYLRIGYWQCLNEDMLTKLSEYIKEEVNMYDEDCGYLFSYEIKH